MRMHEHFLYVLLIVHMFRVFIVMNRYYVKYVSIYYMNYYFYINVSGIFNFSLLTCSNNLDKFVKHIINSIPLHSNHETILHIFRRVQILEIHESIV